MDLRLSSRLSSEIPEALAVCKADLIVVILLLDETVGLGVMW